MFLDFDSLYNECRSQNFIDGKKLYYDDAVKMPVLSLVGGRYTVSGSVREAAGYKPRITFGAQGEVYDYECDCDSFHLTTGPCRHVVALSLAFEEQNPDVKSGKSARLTDATALAIISDYNDLRRKSRNSGDAKATLTPYLDFSGGAALRLSIGKRKTYTVKDVADLVAATKNKEYRRYGVDLELIHTLDNFDELSGRLLTFVCRAAEEKLAMGVNPFRYKDELRLSGGDLDTIATLYENSFIPKNKEELYFVSPFSSPCPLKVMVSETDEGFEITLSDDKAEIVSGKDYDYVISEGKIYRVSKEYVEVFSRFYETLKARAKLFVSRPDMTIFYNGVLVPIARFVPVECPTFDLSSLAAEPLTCSVYISYEIENGLNVELSSSYNGKKIDILSENVREDFVRDWESENAIRSALAEFFPTYPTLRIYEDDEIFAFMSEGVRKLMPYAQVFVESSAKKYEVKRRPRFTVGVRLRSNVLNIDVTAQGYSDEEVKAILGAYVENRRFAKLESGFVDLSDASLALIKRILSHATVSEEGYSLPAYYTPYLNEELSSSLVYSSVDDNFAALVKSLSVANTVDCPAALDKVMRNYQKSGFAWLKSLKNNSFGGILADDMGLGKTLQVLALLLDEKSTCLIVCPTTLVLNWKSEAKKFAPDLKVLVVSGSMEERRKLIATASEYDLVITSYDLIRRDVDLYDTTFTYAIADQAQFIKNPDTKNALSVKRIKSKYRFALTGTPIENHLGELWSIFDFIMPGYLGTYKDYREEYELPVLSGSDSARNKLSRIIKPFVLRRLKSEVLTELPPKTETVFPSPLTGEQKTLYEANLSALRNQVRTDSGNKIEVLSMLMRLRQICCDPSLVYSDYNGNSEKKEACLDIIRRAVDGGHKVLVFSQFTSMLDVLKKRLMSENISFFSLKGDTPKTERLKMVNKFNSDDTKVFLVSLKAGGTGLNLTGADVVIHYDPWWNDSVMNQATDRAYRMGQIKPVQVYKLVLSGSLEEKILELQEAKSSLSSLVVGKSNGLKEIVEYLRQDEKGSEK